MSGTRNARPAITLILAVSLIGCGCKDPPIENLGTSPDGRYIATREILGHCGGATVGYRSEFALVDSKQGGKPIAHLFFRGLPRLVVKWTGSNVVGIDAYLAAREEVTKRFVDGAELKVTFRELQETEGEPHVCCIAPHQSPTRN